MQGFVHLEVHTQYSIVDGLIDITQLCEKAKQEGMFAVAITDWCNLFAAVKWTKIARQYGLKPLIGAQCLVATQEQERYANVILLCQNNQGYQGLMRLVTRAYREGKRARVPLIEHQWLKEAAPGLLLLSDCTDESLLLDWKAWFPARYYLKLQRLGRVQERELEQTLFSLATRYHLPLVATNAVMFLEKDAFEAHQARVCIQAGTILDDTIDKKEYVPAQYFKSGSEMQALFQDYPEVLENTLHIARRCTLDIALGEVFLPNPPVPMGFTVESYLRTTAFEGLETRLRTITANHEGPFDRESYTKRLALELDVIIPMGFAGYFLIVADFIGWAKKQKIPVGPGRGSGAGSLVAFALGITDLDPLPYELLFERFLNPERVSMPDFDIDFCMEHRDRVIEYVANRYGSESVAQIATFGTMAAKAVVRDCGRVLGQPYGFVDKIAKLIPFELGMTLSKALEQEPLLKERMEAEEEVKTLIQLALKLEGVVRNVGKHAGGVVIAPSLLTDFTPLYCEEHSSQMVSQYDKDDVEAVGLIKFDFLGLKTLTVIDWALRIVNEARSAQQLPLIELQHIKLNDAKTFDLLKKCQTTAVFQLESRGMKDLIRRLQPDTFEEIIALVALFRPGPLQSGMVDDFIHRKHGKAPVDYPHPDLVSILKPTYGVILYQEQVMQIAQVLAGYTLGSADLLRRAMGKKKAEEMAQQREIFIKGACLRGVSSTIASSIFDLMEKFAGYGFNKSHSAAYALVSYQTAWLKAHYPSAFMAAALSAELSNTDKILVLLEEAKSLGLTIVPPSITKSSYYFTVREGGAILYGLGAIKGMGLHAVEALIEARATAPHTLVDLCLNVDLRKVNRRVWETLIRAGACDPLHPSRAYLMTILPDCLLHAERIQKQLSEGQQSLFPEELQLPKETTVSEMPLLERLRGEKETLGVYLTGHPLEAYTASLKALKVTPFTALAQSTRPKVCVAGLVQGIRTLFTKRGDKMGIVTLEEHNHRLEVTVFSDVFAKARGILVKDALVVIEGVLQDDPYTGTKRLRAENILDLDAAQTKKVQQEVKSITLIGSAALFSQHTLAALKELLQKYQPGACPCFIELHQEQAKTSILLGKEWQVSPHPQLLEALKALLGELNVLTNLK